MGTGKTPERLAADIETLDGLKGILPMLRAWPDGVWLVGGAVRDLMLGLVPAEIDLLTDGDTISLAEEISAGSSGAKVTSHPRFMTASVEGPSIALDIARTRIESYPSPGSLPHVREASLADDLGRRDFTVNAIAIRLNAKGFGEVSDPHAGMEDLEGRLLRVLHAESFRDDPTRLWRLARYRARLEFEVEEETALLAARAVDENALAAVSPERIGSEFLRMTQEERPMVALMAAGELGLLDPIGATSPILSSIEPAHELLGGEVSLERLSIAACWFGSPIAAESARSLGLGKAEVSLARQAGSADGLVSRLARLDSPADIDELLAPLAIEVVATLTAAFDLEAGRLWIERLRGVHVEISGADLIAEGVPEGPKVGVGLGAARRHVLEGGSNELSELIAIALGAIGGKADDGTR